MNSVAHKPIVGEFMKVVDQIYGTYLDSLHGFTTTATAAENEYKEDMKQAKEFFSKFPTLKHLEPQLSRGYHRSQRNQERPMHLHHVSYDGFLERNRVGGRNWDSAANMSVVMIYQYWEANYRAKIAAALGVKPEQLDVPIIGDIRLLRNSILHYIGIALPEVNRCKILDWFKTGDEIKITKDMFESLVDHILESMGTLQSQPATFIQSEGST